MASIYDLKPAFQRIMSPVCSGLQRIGITPNQVTVFTILLSLLMGILLYQYKQDKWPLLVLPVFLFIRMALNAIDGMMAREFNMTSSFGAILNELGDVFSDTIVYLPLALIPGMPAIPIVVIVILAIIAEMTGVIAVQIGATRRFDGPMGKSDRAFSFGILGLLAGLNIISDKWLNGMLWIIVALLLLTIINRWRKALKESET